MRNIKTDRKLDYSEDQEQLLDVASSCCRDKAPIAKVRKNLTDDVGYHTQIWSEITNLGWLGVALPEKFGGSDLGLAEVVSIMEPMGRALLATPFQSTTLAAQALLSCGTPGQQEKWLPQICGGAIVSLALSELHGDWDLENLTAQAERAGEDLRLSGTKTFVVFAKDADALIVSVAFVGVPALVIVDKNSLPEGALILEKNVDETQRTYRLALDGLTVPVGNLLAQDKAAAALRHIHLAANLLVAAEMCGGISGVMDYTLEYLKTRKQFDRLIGSYQSLKHTMADILLGHEAARNHLYYAAGCFGKGDGREGEIAVRMAKAQASETLAYAADRAIQFHGGFGFTYDCDAQLYRRRAIWGASLHGDAIYHRAKLGGLLL